MTKRTLSNKTRSSILKLSGFRARMATAQGRKTIQKTLIEGCGPSPNQHSTPVVRLPKDNE